MYISIFIYIYMTERLWGLKGSGGGSPPLPFECISKVRGGVEGGGGDDDGDDGGGDGDGDGDDV